MIEIPFCNDFYSIVSPENKNEIIEHCLNAVELPEQEFEWGEHCLSQKVHLKLTGFSDLLKDSICLLYTSPSPRDISGSRMPSSA